jgi:2,4-dienoyl-CoA reductase-like NADH-dependent reductase (Old Yellow Enzyme family)/thioredoxin reductase
MKLFEPIRIRGMEIKNRILMAPMGTHYPLRGEQSKNFYSERAKGGVGAITLGSTNVDAFFSERFVDGARKWITDTVHEYDVRIGPDLWHGNLLPSLPMKGVMQEWIAPSAGTPSGGKSLARVLRAPSNCYCRELTISEIEEIIGKFAEAASGVKQAGFDYITIHGGHGNGLADQFFSPRDNRRTDKYGGDLAGRMRFGLELAEALRSAIGPDYPLFWRMSAEHLLPGGNSLEESIEYAAKLVKAGVDVIDVSMGHEESYMSVPINILFLGADQPMGSFLHYAEAFKRKLSAPIIGVGRIHSLEVAEEAISQGKVDMVNVGRQLLADPYWVEKIASGRFDDINPCQCCNTCVWTFREEQAPIKCVVNPSLGKEAERVITPAKEKKKVVVVGGGLAGMEAAKVAAQRRHEVVLFEKAQRLGGMLLWQEKLPHKPTVSSLIKYFEKQLETTGAEIRLNEECSLTSIKKVDPDVVIIAAGSNPTIPDIPGIGMDHVTTALDILIGRKQAGDRVAIIGGGLVGCDTAELLAAQDKKVTMVETLPAIASVLYAFESHYICYKLGSKGVTMMTSVKGEEITEDGLLVTDAWGKLYTIEADTVVLAVGAKPNDALIKELDGKVSELYAIGDCVEPRRMINAIHEGADVGYQI